MNFLIRTITAFVFAFVLLFCMQKGGAWFMGLFGICTILSTIEFTRLANKYKNAQISLIWATLAATAFYCAVVAFTFDSSFGMFGPFMLCVVIMLIRELYARNESPITTMAYSLFPVAYIALPFSLLIPLGYMNGQYNPAIPVALFLFLWCNDVGAYCTGCTIGKHKLFERVSPKKTWEGSAGGAVLTVAGAVALYYALPGIYGDTPLLTWMGMALVVVLFGTWGDLTESLMKREMGIKDSGKILPGHGGMLDRFDSALLAIPAVFAYFDIVMSFIQ